MRILSQILDYKLEWGMAAWALHRLTGVALFLYLIPHVLITGELIAAAQAGDAEGFAALYAFISGPAVFVLECLLAGVVLLHAFNGVRILLVDFTGLVRKEGALNAVFFALWAAAYAGLLALMILTYLAH